MKPRKKYKPKGTSVPMIVNREIHKTTETLHEHATLLAFKLGYATKQHFDQIVLMVNLMEVATQIKPNYYGNIVRDKLKLLSDKVKARYDRVSELVMCKADIDMLALAIAEYDAFWKCQTTTLYNQCVAEVNAFYREVRA